MFGKKKSFIPEVEYNPRKQKAILKCSICTGEQVAGFKDMETGKFIEVCVIRSSAELELFMKKYNLVSVSKEY